MMISKVAEEIGLVLKPAIHAVFSIHALRFVLSPVEYRVVYAHYVRIACVLCAYWVRAFCGQHAPG